MASEPIAYAQVSTADDMRWIVRFVGALTICLLFSDFLPIPYFWFTQKSFRSQFRDPATIAFLSGTILAIIAAVGMVNQRRVGVLGLALLLVAHATVAVLLPGLQRLAILPGYLVNSAGQLAIWRRAERRGVLIRPRPIAVLDPPSSDDMSWFLPLTGCYILLPVLRFVADAISRLVAQQPVFQFQFGALGIALLALRVPIALFPVRRRPIAILWAMALFPASVIISLIASSFLYGLSFRDVGLSLLFRLPEAFILPAFAGALYVRMRRSA